MVRYLNHSTLQTDYSIPFQIYKDIFSPRRAYVGELAYVQSFIQKRIAAFIASLLKIISELENYSFPLEDRS